MLLWFHLLVVWLVWGTTYVAIAESLVGLPPFAVASLRFIAAGLVLLALARLSGQRLELDRRKLLWSFVLGLLLVAIGDGGIIWAVQHVPSGQVAVLVATTPIFMVLIDAKLGRIRPPPPVILSVCMGLLGTVIIAWSGGGPNDALRSWGVLVTLVASASWALASLLVIRVPLPKSSLGAMGLQMIAGGLVLALPATLLGEWQTLEGAHLVGRPGWAIGYLIFFSCVLGFSSYLWLVRHVRPALAASFAYVNPVVAVFAGHLILGEPLTARVLIGTPMVILAVLLVLRGRRHREAEDPIPGPAPGEP